MLLSVKKKTIRAKVIVKEKSRVCVDIMIKVLNSKLYLCEKKKNVRIPRGKSCDTVEMRSDREVIQRNANNCL